MHQYEGRRGALVSENSGLAVDGELEPTRLAVVDDDGQRRRRIHLV
jgi:hypothetical protein